MSDNSGDFMEYDTEVDALGARIADLTAEVERLHSWDGLMSLLDEHWPAGIFPTLADDDQRDPGPRIVSLLRWVEILRVSRDAALTEERRLRELYHAQFYLRVDIQVERDEARAEVDQWKSLWQQNTENAAQAMRERDEALAEAEWLRPRRIETVEELDALPAGVGIKTPNDAILEKFADGLLYHLVPYAVSVPLERLQQQLPAVVLWSPEAQRWMN